MAFRLVALIDGRAHRFPLDVGEQTLGSHPECQVRLAHSTVSRRHARVVVQNHAVNVEDLGSRNGIRLGTEKVSRITLLPGVELRVGAVPVRLEEVPDGDLQAAVVLDEPAERETPTPVRAQATTYASGPEEAFVTEALPRLLGRLADGAGPELMAQLVGEALFQVLPCTEIKISRSRGGILFQAERPSPSRAASNAVALESAGGEIELLLPSAGLAAGAKPLVESAAAILRLAESRQDEPGPRPPQVEPPSLPDPPTVDPVVSRIYAQAAKVARGDVGVLILGESGTGKEVLARYVHRASPRSQGPFLGLDCAALPQDLLEAELFGIEKGVATGVDERAGKFEQATGGTLFLDEIGDMALETQAKILRILQSGECYRLGSRKPREVDVRIVAATNRDVKAMLAAGTFRTDLYHRIATWVVEIPPLRQRRGDVANLAAYFLSREAKKRGLRVAGISQAAVEALGSCAWPGNVRQLENEIARAVLFIEDGELLDSTRLGDDIRNGGGALATGTLSQVLEQTERRAIEAALAENDGKVDPTAAWLGISRATLYRRMRALGIDPGAIT